MRRTTDRLHVGLRLWLTAVLVMSPAIGLSAGTAAREVLSQQAAADTARLHQVEAVLAVDVHRTAGTTSGEPVWVAASWTSPAGLPVQGRVPASAGDDAGDRIMIWTTATGERRHAPLSPSDVALQSAAIGTVTALGVVVTAVLAHLGGVALLDRSRARRWAAGWAAVEPSWRKQLLR
ncbi:Rv1733c family protein [Klenkia terrae]|jgi:hypothetical protein|nr:hypothetical protein [Klenkia terrae]